MPLLLTLLLACVNEEGCGDCPEGESCTWTGYDDGGYACVAPCAVDEDCAAGACDGAGSSCPACQDVITWCD